MAGGPIYPSSAYPADSSGRLFPTFYGGVGGNAAPHDEGLGVKASLDADATWELRFPMPPSIPTGTLKLRLLALANATSGVAKVTVKDKNVAAGASPSAAALTSTPAGNDVLVVALTFNTTGWTLAQVSCWLASIIWE